MGSRPIPTIDGGLRDDLVNDVSDEQVKKMKGDSFACLIIRLILQSLARTYLSME